MSTIRDENRLLGRFPLGDTSTVYMSGEAAYTFNRPDQAGIITVLVLSPAVAGEIDRAVWSAMANAWDEGHDRVLQSLDEGPCGPCVCENPYRTVVDKLSN